MKWILSTYLTNLWLHSFCPTYDSRRAEDISNINKVKNFQNNVIIFKKLYQKFIDYLFKSFSKQNLIQDNLQLIINVSLSLQYISIIKRNAVLMLMIEHGKAISGQIHKNFDTYQSPVKMYQSPKSISQLKEDPSTQALKKLQKSGLSLQIDKEKQISLQKNSPYYFENLLLTDKRYIKKFHFSEVKKSYDFTKNPINNNKLNQFIQPDTPKLDSKKNNIKISISQSYKNMTFSELKNTIKTPQNKINNHISPKATHIKTLSQEPNKVIKFLNTNKISQNNFLISNNKNLLPTIKKQQELQQTSVQFRQKKEIEDLLEQIQFEPQINQKQFKIEQQLGKGYIQYLSSYAEVFKARKIDTNELFAIKIYEFKNLQQPYKIKNIVREIQAMKKLDHPNIIKLHYVLRDIRSISLVMEYQTTTTLKSFQKKFQSQPINEKIGQKIITQMSSALNYMHEHNFVHRDIKSDNVLIDNNHNIKIIDFGFSIHLGTNQKLNHFCGTPHYMSPQIIQKQFYCGKKADVWAMGVLYYHLLYNQFPFRAENKNELNQNIIRCHLTNQDNQRKSLKEFFQKIFVYEEKDRYSSGQLLEIDHLQQQQQ